MNKNKVLDKNRHFFCIKFAKWPQALRSYETSEPKAGLTYSFGTEASAPQG
jgi:hypothetical protein